MSQLVADGKVASALCWSGYGVKGSDGRTCAIVMANGNIERPGVL